MFVKLKKLLLIAFALALMPCALADSKSAAESKLTLALVYNVIRFVDWPEGSIASPDQLTVCIAGETYVGLANESLAGRAVKDRAIRVHDISDIQSFQDSETPCHAVFVSSTFAQTAELLETLAGLPVLTISDQPGFAEDGGVVEIGKKKGRLRMRVNVSVSADIDLSINSQMIALAELVRIDPRDKP